MAMNERPARRVSIPGLVVSHRGGGFHAELTASREAFSAVRRTTVAVLVASGVARGVAESAELVVSELMGNVLRASGGGQSVPLVVEVSATAQGAEVIVQDAVPEQPHHSGVALDSGMAESGRGLLLLDILTDCWSVEPAPLGKQVRCHLSG
ncbi:ATP-binding protein [Streptomyces sp. NPDC052287]|uniref:ATP-binding protein n=1 Tax=Streptomyces sp. NPDC052287 TaxID=3154950 RepID=UPI0034290DB7